MAENTNNSAVLETEEELTSYTTETNAGAGTGTSAIAPGYGTGRRKEAVARVRLVPGTGKWTRSFCSSSKASSTLSSSLMVAAPPVRPVRFAWALPAR